MMRTIEILLVIIIITGAFIIAAFFAVLPSPRQVSPLNLRRLALTTLQTLDGDHSMSTTVFKPTGDSSWASLQIALSASLPPNIVYNFSVYEVQSNGKLFNPIKSISNARDLGVGSDSASYLTASSNVTFSSTPQKIGESGGGSTLYILNCSDANGWWITGYTAQKLAGDLQMLLSPYFQATIMVQNTTQLGLLLNGTKITNSPYEKVASAVLINTFGETVPIPSGYYLTQGAQDSYAKYCYLLGQRVRQYNWTWASIVGWPLYYVSNTVALSGSQNDWGIYGMVMVGSPGLQSFLRGLDNQAYVYGNSQTGSPGVVYLSSVAKYYSDYYGIFPSTYSTATRALSTSILGTYHLSVSTYIFDQTGNWIAGAVYRHAGTGAFLSLGLARTPDVRLTAVGLLSDYKPRLYRSEYTAAGTSRLVVLQLGQVGGA